jgi:hypothetical protein
MPEIAGQRLRRIGLTRGDIGGSLQPGNNPPETGLRGCPQRIRTSAWRKELIVNSRVEAMNFVAQPKVEETVRI